MYHVDRGYADEQKRRTAHPKWLILFKLTVFFNVFAFVFQTVFIGNLFFYLSSRWCLHNFPRLVNKDLCSVAASKVATKAEISAA
jgi:hypothetical protein